MRVYYFGAWSREKLGHHLYRPDGYEVREQGPDAPPFEARILDAGLIHHRRSDAKCQDGVVHRSVVNGWTVLSFWDQSGDSRPASNSAFVFEADHGRSPTRELLARAAESFPGVFARPGFPFPRESL